MKKPVRIIICCLFAMAVTAAWAKPDLSQSDVGPAAPPIQAVPADQTVALENLLRQNPHPLILVGETHDSWADHQLQMQVIEQLHADGQTFVIGLEWVQQPFQAALDDFVARRIDEPEMLRRVAYYQRWRFDYRLVRDVFRYARDKDIRLLALNADKAITDKVMKLGLDGISPEERAQLPQTYYPAGEPYANLLRELMGMHKDRDAEDEAMFQRFLNVQLSWDEAMADASARYLQQHPDHKIVLLAGRGHTQDHGIPKRFRNRTGKGTLSIARYQDGSPFDQMDYWVLTAPQKLPKAGLLGVVLVETETGMRIDALSETRAANPQGLKAGDSIVAIDQSPIKDFVDVKWALMDIPVGETVELLLLREVDGKQTSLKQTVTTL